MHLPPDLPEIAFVRVRTAGGPYRIDDILSVAFTSPVVGRLAAHAPARDEDLPRTSDPVVPESMTVVVTLAAGPYGAGDRLTLSFVDPRIARIHPSGSHDAARPPVLSTLPSAEVASLVPSTRESPRMPSAQRTLPEPSAQHTLPEPSVTDALRQRIRADAAAREEPRAAVRVSLRWDPERAERFVRVVDKLFTVDRLGWYRHVLAVRMLVPDDVSTGDAAADIEANRALRELRTAVSLALGRPLLAACMPGFSVTPQWLDELDSVAAARAVAALRETILPHVTDGVGIDEAELDAQRTLGIITRRELTLAASASVETLLPVLIPCLSLVAPVTQTLNGYRYVLAEAFGQIAGSAEAVRLGAMSQPNHALDDRLWQLVGAIGETFGKPTAA